jgi:hypothetical protein
MALLADQVAAVARPPRHGKSSSSRSDLLLWRQIFELYLDARVFFAIPDIGQEPRDSRRALDQLVWFQNEVERQGIRSAFRLEGSVSAFSRFLSLNATLVQHLQFVSSALATHVLRGLPRQQTVHSPCCSKSGTRQRLSRLSKVGEMFVLRSTMASMVVPWPC